VAIPETGTAIAIAIEGSVNREQTVSEAAGRTELDGLEQQDRGRARTATPTRTRRGLIGTGAGA
jgi:hypothetical protein